MMLTAIRRVLGICKHTINVVGIQYTEFWVAAQTPESESLGAQSHAACQVPQVTLIDFRAALSIYIF